MSELRRYLTNFDANRSANILTDVLVIGSGVAGARAALEASRHGSVTILSKGDFLESATRYAQGGIASAIGSDDSAKSHYDDTLRVGCGLNRPEAVELLVRDGPKLIDELVGWGMELDRTGSLPALGREGGHSTNRILHSHGDQTGRALAETLARKVRGNPAIRVFEHCFLIDLLTVDGMCVGATTFHPKHGHQLIWSKRVILATGGCGRLWRETTNPACATGDGMAAAFRAGARLRDMEMMQFHPTTLYVAGAARALISEAVRGEGAFLVDRSGQRFMTDYHADAELAPRDIVSRAIHDFLQRTRANCVYLDVRHIANFQSRFPFISKLCEDFQINVIKDLIPVRPSAHYMVGGVETRLDATTSLPGLLACGESACSGVHGANRLASNSLLEGLVFGRIAGETAGLAATHQRNNAPVHGYRHRNPESQRTELDLGDIQNSLRSVMWRNVGIVRSEERLRETCDIFDFWSHYSLDKTFDDTRGWELQNQLTVGRLVAQSARLRRTSVGVHYRADGSSSPVSPQGHVVAEFRDATPRVAVAAEWLS